MGEEIINNEVIIDNPTDSIEPLTPETTNTEIDNIDASTSNIGNFFGTIQESVTIAWRYHLKTHKHYIHIATQEYYYKALNLVDKIIEEYQGTTGLTIDNYTNTIFDNGKSEVEYFNELKSFIVNAKTENPFEEEIISDIDDLIGTIDSTLYQLTSFCESAIKSFDEFCFEDYDVIGVEGGVDGVFDTVTKTTKDNLAPNGATGTSKPKSCNNCKDTESEKEEKEEEEEE